MRTLERLIRPRGRLPWIWIGAFACASVALMLLSEGWHAQVRAALAAQSRARAERMRTVPKAPSRQELDDQKRWAALEMERTFAWDRVFKVIEQSADPDVELLEFHPDRQQRTVLLKGVAASPDALFRYLENLAAQPALAQVHLYHRQPAERGRLHAVEFEIRAGLVL
jgi:Tfp pilus assembly protein PilN